MARLPAIYTVTSDGMRRYAFKRMLIPTKEVTDGEIVVIDDRDLLVQLNEWNASAPGLWQYWI